MTHGLLWRLWRPGVCCGLVVCGGRVIEAAPYLRRATLGRPWLEVKRKLRASGWHGAPVGAVSCSVPRGNRGKSDGY